MRRIRVFEPIETLAPSPNLFRGAIAQRQHAITVVPHFDELVIRVGEDKHIIRLGTTERILDELARGKSVEVTLTVAIPGSEMALEIKTTWVGSMLAGGSKASTLKLLEDATLKLVSAPSFRGLLGSDQADLMEGLLQFVSFEREGLTIAQVCEIWDTEGMQWMAKNWYTSSPDG